MQTKQSKLIDLALRLAEKGLLLFNLFSPSLRRSHSMRKLLEANHYDTIWAQVATKLGGSIESMPGGFARISIGEATTFVRGPQVRLDDSLALKMAGNKALLYKLLSELQINSVSGYCAYTTSSVSNALRFLKTNGGPVVVKPAAGTGGGAGITTGITSNAQLYRATVLARRFCDDLIVEEQVAGENYRLLFLGGEMIDAVHRCPPSVVGDGKSTISELVDEENRLRSDPTVRRASSMLAKDNEMRLFLANHGSSMRTVPPAGTHVVLKLVINQNNALENHRVVAAVHPSFVELAKKIVTSLDLDLAGVDIIAPDISRPADDQTFVIPDVNTTPGLHHHYLLSNPSPDFDIAETIMRYILFDDTRVISAKLHQRLT